MKETTVSRPRRQARRNWLQRQHDRSLGSKAAFVFVVVFALAAANIVTVSRIFGYLDDVASTVSVAGKLRMLSQKIAYSVALASTGDLSMMSQARRDIDDFGHAWRALGEGTEAFGMPVRLLRGSSRADLARVDAIWAEYRRRVLAMARMPGRQASPLGLAAVRTQAAALLDGTEALLTEMVTEERLWRQRNMLILYALFALDILVLVLAYGAFRRYVLLPLKMLAKFCRGLGRGHYEARISYPVRDEIGDLTQALNDSAAETHALMTTIYREHENLKHAEASIRHQALYDSLTGLPNRQHFTTRLSEAIETAQKDGTTLALIFLDLDLFKEVNDTLGHDMGDELLWQVAERLSNSLRDSDMVARLGGDEFTMIIEGLNTPDTVDTIMENILAALIKPYTLGENTAVISASIGAALCPQDSTDAAELLKSADLAMYVAKEGGRSQCRRFDSSMMMAAMQDRRLQRDLHTVASLGRPMISGGGATAHPTDTEQRTTE